MKTKMKMTRLLATLVGGFFLAGCGQDESKWEKHITEEEIVIEELSGEYDLLFLTDLHMIIRDEQDSKEIQENAQPRFTKFENREEVPSADQWETWITYANEQEVDGVLLGGDIIDYPSQSNLNLLDQGLNGLRMPYLYTLGNHDWTYPWDYMTESGKEQYLPLLYPYMKGDTAIQVLNFGEFYVVAVDDCANQVNETILPEYEKVLEEGKPVIVLTHVPFWTESVLTKANLVWTSPVVIGGGNFGGAYPNEASRKFIELTTAKNSPVVAVLAGHVHFYDKDYIMGEKDVLQIVGDAGYNGAATLLHIKGSK
ncbi:MAG TPA: metallophosphoesterase [Lachnospiraceae bacterium]|nr:metallophosphoesterase [Lachnospiraceae bacterium]